MVHHKQKKDRIAYQAKRSFPENMVVELEGIEPTTS